MTTRTMICVISCLVALWVGVLSQDPIENIGASVYERRLSSSWLFPQNGMSKRIFHDVLSRKYSINVCEGADQTVPESVKIENRFQGYSLTVGLNNSGFEYLINNDTAGFGIYPSSSSEKVIIQAWNQPGGKLVTIELDLATGKVSKPRSKFLFGRVAPMCPSDIIDTSVAKRDFAETTVNLLRRMCRSLLSPIAWTECRFHQNAICLGVGAALGAASPIPGDSVFWYWACRGALIYVCGQVGNADPTSAEVCEALEDYIRNNFG